MPTSEERRLADEALLASLGYKQEFKREFSSLQVFGIAFSIIGLLPSIASVLITAIPNGGPVAMVWGWAVASFFILCIGLSMAELGSAAPTSGGLYFWTFSLSSPWCRNFLSWIVGYANTIATISAVASIDWGCAVQVMAAAAIGSGETFIATSGQLYGVFVGIVLSHIVVCSLGTAVLARLQTVYVVMNVGLCLAVIIALPAATPKAFMNDASFALGNFTNYSGWPSGFAFILSMLAPHWTIGGFDSSVHISEEASNASTAVPRAIVGAIAIAGVLGTAINMVLAFCMGTDLDAIIGSPIGQPMAVIFYNSFGQRATLGIWAVVVVVQYTMGSSMLLASSRQVFAFSRDGALPFSGWLYRMNRYTRTPVNTVLFSGVAAMALGLLVFAGAEAINAVFSLSVVASYAAYATPTVVRFVCDNDFRPGPFSLGRASLPIGIISVSWMAFISVVFLFPSTPAPAVDAMNYTAVVFFGTMFFSVAWYYCPRYGGVHWFRGPVATIGLANAGAGEGAGDAAPGEKRGKQWDESSGETEAGADTPPARKEEGVRVRVEEA